MTDKTTEPRFNVGQRVRRQDSRTTGRVTGTWQHPGDEFFPPQSGVDVTMDDQFSPRPTPVRYHTLGKDFEPLPDDYLDDGEALEQIARTITHIPGDWAQAAEMLNATLAILHRNDRARKN